MARFCIRTLYQWNAEWKVGEGHVYEERFVVLTAGSVDEALSAGVSEAEAYARENGFQLLKLINTYEIDEDTPEVFSCLRESTLSLEDYQNAYDAGEARHSLSVKAFLASKAGQ